MTEKHVHDCTGPDFTCLCGFKFTVPRFCFSFDVYDNEEKRTIVSSVGNVDSSGEVARLLREAADKLSGRE